MQQTLQLRDLTSFGGVFFCLITVGLASQYGNDFPGPYCERKGTSGCCTSRTDTCSVPIADTLCYCDEFCDRSINGDCCPDYFAHCRNEQLPPQLYSCSKNDAVYRDGAKFKDNCNTCSCRAGRITCDTDVCMVDDALINNIAMISDSLGWTARNYSEFWGHTYDEGLSLRLGTHEPTRKVKAMSRLSNKLGALPTHFDSRESWPGQVSAVRDQGWCGSSWAMSTASVASDRFSILSKGREIVELSSQQLLSCVRRQKGCRGGHLDVAWNYFRKFGVVDEACFPYHATSNDVCKITHRDNLESIGCTIPREVPRLDLYKMGPAYSLNNETDIMIEILNSGPVQATMRVYRDFFSYSHGVYRHSAASRSGPSGFHSVRVVGWGEDRVGYTVTKYWIASNSWGTWWGERGYFRILRGVNECEIENYVLASWADVYSQQKIDKSLVNREKF